MPNQTKWFIALLILPTILIFIVGCNQKTVDLGTERNSSNEPEFFDETKLIAELENKASLAANQRFLLPRFSNALKIRFEQIRANKLTKDLDWGRLESLLNQRLNTSELEVKSVRTAWFMIDSSSAPNSPSTSPTDENADDEPEDSPTPSAIVALDLMIPAEQLALNELPETWKQVTTAPRQVVIGSKSLVDAVQQNQSSHQVLGPGSGFWNSRSDLTFAIVPASFADQFERFSRGMTSQEDRAQMLDLMESLKTVKLDLNLSGKALVVVQLELSDAESARELKEKLGPSLAQASNTIRLFVSAIAFEDKELTQLTRDAVLELSNPSSMKMEVKNSLLEIRIRRPSKFDELALAVVAMLNTLKPEPTSDETYGLMIDDGE